MINISDELKQNILTNSISREIILRFPDDDIEIGSQNIVSESFELVNSIMDGDELALGGCIAGQMKIQVININRDLTGKKVNVFLKNECSNGTMIYPFEDIYPSDSLYPGLTPTETLEYQLFSGTVDSAKRQKNRSIKEIIAYDAMYEASNTKITAHFSDVAQYSPNESLKDFIYQFAISVDADYNTTISDFNDNSKISFNDYDLACESEKAGLTVADVLKAYFELNSKFGYISRTGRLQSKNIYFNKSEEITSYNDLEFEEYTTADITNIKFLYNKDFYYSYGTRNRKTSEYVSDNCITKYCTDISEMVKKFYETTSGGTVLNRIFYDVYKYRPMKAVLFAYWWLEPGDKVKIPTGFADVPYVESFIFSRTIKGVNAMRVTIESKGKQYFGKEDLKK